MRRNVILLSTVTVGFLFCLGCGGTSSSAVMATYPVKGRVTYKGKPLTKGSIQFEPTDSGRGASGEIKPDGTFVLTTYKEGDGAVPGMHRVSVSTAKGVVPLKYAQPASSKVEVEVSEDKSEYPIDLN